MFLMLSNLICQMLMWITEYNYMGAFQQHFAPEGVGSVGLESSELLTRFLGRRAGGVGVVNIFLTLFLYPRLVKRFGVNNLEIITPIALILMFLGWPFSLTIFPSV